MSNYNNQQGYNQHTGFANYPPTSVGQSMDYQPQQHQQQQGYDPGYNNYPSSQSPHSTYVEPMDTSSSAEYDTMPSYGQHQQPAHQQPAHQQPTHQLQQQNTYQQPTNLPQMFTQTIASTAINQMAGQALDFNQQGQLADMAMNYGTGIVTQGGGLVQDKIKTAVITSNLKYYFAVDTKYVTKKLLILMFPFHHKNWSIKYDENTPVAPRHEINAPDLYIPVMAFITYILLTGICLGVKEKFTPELLGITASSLLVYLIVEIILLLFVTYMMRVSTDLKYLDLFSYCGYKYVCMISCLVASIMFKSTGYYISLAWCSLAICFFLVRTLKHAITPHASDSSYSATPTSRHKNRLYTLAIIAFLQPVLIWWQTKHLYVE